jgi:hypothetical protein
VFLLFLIAGCQEHAPINPVDSQTPIDTPKTNSPLPGPSETITELIETSIPNSEILPSVEILEISATRSREDFYRIVGLVKNNVNHSITDIKLLVRVFSMTNSILVEEIALISLSTIQPGGISPFILQIGIDLPDEFRLEGQIVEFNESKIEKVDVTIKKQFTIVDDNNNIHVTGEILNNNLFPVEIQNLTSAFFGQDGRLINIDTDSIYIHYLDPGEVSPFRITIHGAAGSELEDIQIQCYADAVDTNPEDFFDIQIENTPNHYVDRLGKFHLVTKIRNHSKVPLTINFMAAIYDPGGQVIDVAIPELPITSLIPGESFPLDFSQWGPLNTKSGTTELMESFSVQWDPHLTWQSELEYIDLQIKEGERLIMPSHGRFEGTIYNKTEYYISRPFIQVSLYDKNSGKILATNSQEYNVEISPGGSIDFYLETEFGLNLNFDEVDILLKVKGIKSE